jgi:microcystin-dependent protein
VTVPFIGEIQIFGFNFNPRGWAHCNGATLPIQQNTALFALIGTTYGGNGATTFKIPNLAGRAVAGPGSGPGLTPRSVGESFGADAVTLVVDQLPPHRHVLKANTGPGTAASPVNAVAASSQEQLLYDSNLNNPMTALATAGGGLPHVNQQPSLAINFSIALQGIFPSFP